MFRRSPGVLTQPFQILWRIVHLGDSRGGSSGRRYGFPVLRAGAGFSSPPSLRQRQRKCNKRTSHLVRIAETVCKRKLGCRGARSSVKRLPKRLPSAIGAPGIKASTAQHPRPSSQVRIIFAHRRTPTNPVNYDRLSNPPKSNCVDVKTENLKYSADRLEGRCRGGRTQFRAGYDRNSTELSKFCGRRIASRSSPVSVASLFSIN